MVFCREVRRCDKLLPCAAGRVTAVLQEELFLIYRRDGLRRLGQCCRWITLCCGLWVGMGCIAPVALRAQIGAQSGGRDPVAVALPEAELDEYVGQYRTSYEPEDVRAVYRDGARLFFDGVRLAPLELIAGQEKDHFFVAGTTMRFTFGRGKDGSVVDVTYSVGNVERTSAALTRFSKENGRLNHSREYARSEVMMPMRDGVKLHAVVLRPVGSEIAGPPLPFLIERTPYGTDGSSSTGVNASKPELAASGYIFVYADIRGRYESQGKFVMNRPIVAHDGKGVDETTDTHDTIDWLLRTRRTITVAWG